MAISLANMAADQQQRTVVIAGATGYLGRFLVSEYQQRGWKVIALVRNKATAHLQEDENTIVIQTQVTEPKTLKGTMDGANLVISAVGITRQRDGKTYEDVDYQANMNLLEEAIRTKVPTFAYVHVLKGEAMAHLPAIRAKQHFVEQLKWSAQVKKIERAVVIAPCGFFSDMRDFLDMAKTGRAYLFGDGGHKINPIHGKDLAKATAEAIDTEGLNRLDVGGPDVFTQKELAELAFDVLQKHPPRITFVWDCIRTCLIRLLPWVSPLTIYGPAQFFLTAMGDDMVGECRGDHHLKDYFAELVREEAEKKS